MIRLRYLFLSVLVVLVAFSAIPFVLSYEYWDADFTVPSWIKNNAGWWADEQIDDGSFVSGIQWLITNDVIILPPTELETGDTENVIPRWVKTTAGWWAGDEINDSTFVAATVLITRTGLEAFMRVLTLSGIVRSRPIVSPSKHITGLFLK